MNHVTVAVQIPARSCKPSGERVEVRVSAYTMSRSETGKKGLFMNEHPNTCSDWISEVKGEVGGDSRG